MLGAGAWGTAIAKFLCERGNAVSLWCRDQSHAAEIHEARENKRRLPISGGLGIPSTGENPRRRAIIGSTEPFLPESLMITSNLESVLDDEVLVVLAVPSHSLRVILKAVFSKCRPWGFINLSKGFEGGSMLLPDAVFNQEDKTKKNIFSVLSGPGFAREVAYGLPVALTLATKNKQFGEAVIKLMHNKKMRIYLSSDVAGVVVGGAVKNVIAIAAGISDGIGLGNSARAALITRGLSEMSRYGDVYGGMSQTFQGLSGLGDLMLTCTSGLSRNYILGRNIGLGHDPVAEIAKVQGTAEGVNSAKELSDIALRAGLDMPITQAVVKIIEGVIPPEDAVFELLARVPKKED